MNEPRAFQVNSASLVSHAGEVDTIGDGLTTAVQAGQNVETHNSAYGQLCQFVPALLNGLQQSMVDGMRTAARSAHDTADTLRSVAALYDSTDGGAAERIRNAR
ncbi:type VII secretion target [Actinoplanes sp. TFC3]|uniref:type VII secretion target n=1 Tax=Actinoplanes sp. TFC3 TaxID=1710355 RepID=UPI00082C73DD|nr:type VII secretion target [Actinoplanes sp. TFC3]